MPEGPSGIPRITNLGPLSRSTEEEIKAQWNECPDGKAGEICGEYKHSALVVLENQDVFPKCDTLEDINSGRCAKIAERVFNEVGDVRIFEAGVGDHVWISYKDKHYDAEVPTGVEDPLDLPFFDRIPPRAVLNNAQMAAEAEGKEPPQTIDDMIEDVTDEFKKR